MYWSNSNSGLIIKQQTNGLGLLEQLTPMRYFPNLEIMVYLLGIVFVSDKFDRIYAVVIPAGYERGDPKK